MSEWVAKLTTDDLEQLARDVDDTQSTPTGEAVHRELERRRDQTTNRWAAFTEDELATMRVALAEIEGEWRSDRLDPLLGEVTLELQRQIVNRMRAG